MNAIASSGVIIREKRGESGDLPAFILRKLATDSEKMTVSLDDRLRAAVLS